MLARLASSLAAALTLTAATALLVVACADQTNAPLGGAPPLEEEPADAGSSPAADGATPSTDAGADAAPTFTGQCASAFGDALTTGFGRIDGLVYAVQKPSDTQCVMPNNDHVVVQVYMRGKVYRMVVNVESDFGTDRRVSYLVKPHALPPPAFADGWHANVKLDYPGDLGVTSPELTPLAMDPLVAAMAKELVVGAPVSVYAESGAGRPESAHKIHRNRAGDARDGAIVIAPTSASPRFMLFRFDNQTF